MERRKFLIGAGSTAIGASAIVGSGAFTSVEADRSVKIDMANDANAFLALEGKDTPNGNEYVANDGTSGTLKLDFSGTDEGGNGLNQNADTIIRDLFEIHNQGTQKVVIGVTNLPDGMSIYADEDGGAVPGSEAGITLNQDAQGKGSNNLPRIPAGGALQRVGVIFRVDDKLGDGGVADTLADFSGTITINAYTEDEV